MSKPLQQLSDEELILLFQKGDEAGFNILVSRYKDPLTNFVFRFLGERDECNDVVQETFVRIFRNRDSYKPIAKFSTWIYTVATNAAKSHLRKRKLWRLFSFGGSEEGPEPEFDIPDASASPDDRVHALMLEERIQKALNALALKYKEIILLRDVQELSYEEISAITGLNVGTVKSRINRARAQLHEMLQDILKE